MAGLFSQAITAFCMSAASSATYNNACNHAVDAGTRQVGIRQQVDGAEDKTTALVATKATDVAGKHVSMAVGAVGFVYKTYRDKSLVFKLPTMGICDSLSNQITPNSYILSFQWTLR